MTSDRKRQANRANAKASTGPKTAKGRQRSALNALRHGLNVSVLQDPILTQELEKLAGRFAGPAASPQVFYYARRVAEAHLDLQRVRACRQYHVDRALSDPKFVGVEADELRLRCSMRWLDLEAKDQTHLFPEWRLACIDPRPLEGAEKLATILSDLTRYMSGLDRYERRALSRRKFAIRDLDAAQRAEREQNAAGADTAVAAPVLH